MQHIANHVRRLYGQANTFTLQSQLDVKVCTSAYVETRRSIRVTTPLFATGVMANSKSRLSQSPPAATFRSASHLRYAR
jgi:hypothetical protein